MVGHYPWTEASPLNGLPDLRAQLARHGGSIIQYQKITSVILLSRTSNHLEWVPPCSSRFLVGVKYALASLLLGWWSLSGLLFTPAVVLNNLLGGADVTDFLADHRALPPGGAGQNARRELEAMKSRQHKVILCMVILFFGLIVRALASSPSM